LLWVIEVLILTATTFLEQPAFGHHAMLGWLDDFDKFSERAVFLVVRDTHSHCLAWYGEGDKYDPSPEIMLWDIDPRDSFTVIRK
jgi:hypothetical protein